VVTIGKLAGSSSRARIGSGFPYGLPRALSIETGRLRPSKRAFSGLFCHGAEAFGWTGTAMVGRMAEWPRWAPPAEMVERWPHLRPTLAAGGVEGGPDNPLGARALYLYQGDKDTLYRIHGTNEPAMIGRSVSSGCIRMTDIDVIDLYNRVKVGAMVKVI
jgi:lipoprotein-anchoring transpeptidase ErfK/SrfK